MVGTQSPISEVRYIQRLHPGAGYLVLRVSGFGVQGGATGACMGSMRGVVGFKGVIFSSKRLQLVQEEARAVALGFRLQWA